MSHINKGDIHAYLDGALGAYPEEAARHVREHLDTCRACAQLLEDERRLREEASAILAASALGPVELDSLEELRARAAAVAGPKPGRPSLLTRVYSLRWAAMVVISLGAGWMARDLTGPAGDVARGAVAEPVVNRIEVRPSADEELLERDNAGGLAQAETLRELQGARAGRLAEAEAPRESRGTTAGRLAEAETPPESPDAAVVGGVALGSDRRAVRLDDDAVLDQVEAVPARQRAESAAALGVEPADANLRAQAADPQVEALSLFDELRRPASAADRRDAASLLNNAAPGPSVAASLSTTPFLVPGLPVLDVRLAPESDGLTGGRGSSLVVTQELEDGRVVELQFVSAAGDDPALREPLQERSGILGRTRPTGWRMAVRDVPGGVAVLSGPLTEPELEELLDRAFGPR